MCHAQFTWSWDRTQGRAHAGLSALPTQTCFKQHLEMTVIGDIWKGLPPVPAIPPGLRESKSPAGDATGTCPFTVEAQLRPSDATLARSRQILCHSKSQTLTSHVKKSPNFNTSNWRGTNLRIMQFVNTNWFCTQQPASLQTDSLGLCTLGLSLAVLSVN